MPVFLVTSPDGKKYEVNGPEGSTIEQAIQYVQTNLVQSSPEVAQAQPKEGLAAAFAGGFKRLLSTGETAAESLIDPELAAKRGLERAQQLGQEYAPGASLEKVKQAYAERGFFPAVGEAISQIPTALAEQAPQIAATLGSAKAGALAGSAFGPVGSVIGGLGGATIPSLIQLYGANIERQAQEKAPEISRTAALGAAVPGAALEVASTFIPLGRNLVGKLLGPGAAQALARGSNEAIERAAQESLTASLLKGTSVGLLAEIPTEVTQQMLERLQAGLPLTTEDALKEYGEAAYGAGLVGGPFGAGARALGRPAAREQFEQLQQEEAARLAVSEEELAQRFPDVLPGGFKIEREELGKEMAPQGFSIMVEGRDEPLSVVDTQEEADAKFASLTKIRAEERENLLKEEEKINADVQKARDKLERLEATEQTNTDEYQALKAEFPAMMDESAQKIKDLYDRSESLAKPLTVMPFGEVERVNEQFKVVGPDAKPVGTFKTLGEAETTVQQAVGEDVFKQTQQNRETAKELYKTFVPQMRKFGLGDVGLNIVDRIENGAGGAYLNKLIRVSLEDTTPVQTMRHESLHAMKDLGFFTPQQWRALEERANKQWIKEFLEGQKTKVNGQEMTRLEGYRKLGYSEQDIVEEAIADAFGSYDRGAKPPPGMIAALFKKIKNFFSSLGQALRGAGFQSADDIFQQIERGRLKPAAQPAAEAKPVAEEKISLKPKESAVTYDKNTGKLDLQTGEAVRLSGLSRFGDGKDLLADYVPERGTSIFALHPDKWVSTFGSLTLKDPEKITRYRPSRVEITPDTLVADMALANKFYRSKNPADAQAYADSVKKLSEANLQNYRMPELLIPKPAAKPAVQEKLSLKTIDDVINDGVDRLVKSARTNRLRRDEDRLLPGSGRADTNLTKVQDGIEKRLKELGVSTERVNGENQLDKIIYDKVLPAYRAKLKEFENVPYGQEKYSLAKPSEWKATDKDIKQADKYFDENGVLPYTSEGQIDVPLDVSGTKYSIKKPYDQKAMAKDQTLKNDPLTGLPLNANGTVTLYFPTDNAGARDLAKTKRLKGATPEANRVYLTNESSAAAVQAKPGLIDQPLGGANVLLQVDPSLLQSLGEYEDGRKDFFIPIAEGQYFAKKMAQTKLFTLNAPRTKGLHPDRTLSQVTKMVNDAADAWAKASKKERAEMFSNAKATLREQHNIEKLFGANAKLEKTNIGEYGLTYNGKKVMSTGLGLASAQKINDEQRATTCPQSAICESLCLGETSGQNLLYGGDGQFRSGPRLSQFLKTEALVVNPEAFATVLIKQIDTFRNAAKKLGYQAAIRLNVTSDFNPKTFENIINMFPDVMFYDYTKLDTKPIAPNHHLTYSSTGASQVVNGEVVYNKESNWDRMVDKILSNGKNVAMAFTSRNDMPKAIFDERTGKTFQVWNGDEYDARFLDPVRKEGDGWIVGLTNKDNTTKPEEAAKKHNGFFLDYDAKRDGDTLIIRDQSTLKPKDDGKPAAKVIPIAKLSLKKPTSPAFKQWFGESKIVNKDGTPMIMYHGTRRDFTTPETRGNRNAFFVSPDPNFANKYALNDLDWYPDKKGFGPVEEGAQVYPVYISAKNPFDYENADHLAKIIPNFRKALKEQEGYDRSTIEDLVDDLRAGKWTSVEFANDYDLFELAGFDAFYTKEMGRKNLGVLYPNQIKSATGNMGTYSAESPDIRYSLKRVGFPTAKEAKDAVKNAVMPDNEAFKLYNAGNQWVDKDGKPRVFYHATAREFFEFTPAGQSQAIFLAETPEEAEGFGSIAEDKLRREIYRALNKEEKLGLFQRVVNKAVEDKAITQKQGEDFMRQANRKVPEYGSFGDIEQNVYDALLDLSPTRMTIMPLYARAMTPFDFENKDHVNQVIGYIEREIDLPMDFPEKWLIGMKGRISQGLWQAIEDKRVQQAIRALGFDAFTVRENRTSPKNYAVYKPEQVKSVTGNDGQFSLETKDIRYSLPTLSQAANDRIKEVAPGRIELGWTDRVIGGFKRDFTWLRQAAINRYDSLAKFDKRLQEQIRKAGGPELLADQSAEFAALQSDVSAGVAASAMGIGERQGGVPVYRNGFTTIDTSVKGLTEALAPLAKYGDPEVYQRYQFWAGWKRGRRLLKEGREELYNASDAKLAQEIEAQHPEFVQVQKDLIAFNNGIVNYGVQTGVLSRERAQVYTQYADYIPFYRQLDLDKTIGPNPFSGISGVRGPKELKGGEAPLADFLETMVRNTQSMINAGMKNAAAQRATKVALQINETERLPGPATGIDVYTQLENGQVVYYRASDQLFIEALKSLNMPDLPFIGLLSAPANALRNLVTKDPGFMMANLLRDSLSSYVTSGQKITPIVGTMVNFGKALSAKDKNLQALFNAGIIGGYDFSQNIQQSGEALSADLNKKASKDAILLRPFKSIWEALEKGTTASDAATRMAVYERVMKETGNEAEAISRAMEVMNFSRKGNSVLIRIATAAIPFFNARLQGLDLFYRASTGQMNTNDAKEIKRRFWVRGMTMAALSVMYYLSVADDEEYQKQEEETKDNNWIFPSLGIRIPIPFEVGVLFKTMPERITALLMGNDTGKDLSASTVRALVSTFAFNPIPQTFKPLFEVATNFNFFTMRPIVGQGMQEVEAKFQVGPGTSKTAEYIGGLLNLSPLKVDQLIKGYTGTIGGYVTDVVDSITSEFSDMPKASLRFEQLPVVKRFALDPEARGAVTQFYELQRSVDTVVRTMNLLEKTARPEEFAKYLEDNIGLLAAKDYVRDIEKEMKGLRDMRRVINSSDMEPDEKRDLLTDLGRMENNLTANIKEVKKAVSQLK